MDKFETLKERFCKRGLEGFTQEEVAAFALALAGEKDAASMGEEVVGAFGGLDNALKAEFAELVPYAGEKGSLALCLMGKTENYLRQAKEEKEIIASSLDILDYAQRLLGQSRTEVLTAVFLDYGGNILTHAQFGGEANNYACVSVRSILKYALLTNCAKVFLAHNHPAGGGASKSDVDFTNKLLCALRSAGVFLLDHVILGGGEVYSFYDKGLISKMEEEYSRAYGKA
jgi:DNA repair protein RadC